MLELTRPITPIHVSVKLSGSKSISNRLVVLKEVLNAKVELINLSDSEDTQLLLGAVEKIKSDKAATINIEHAGTDMRFLTGLLSITEGEWTLTGSERMKQRPIAELIRALANLGAKINYLEKEGFPPLKIVGTTIRGGFIEIDSSISSQFISALLLIAPRFQSGLCIKLRGKMVSAPYVDMTIKSLKCFNVKVEKNENEIRVYPSKNRALQATFFIESDWSSASYWYSICALAKGSCIRLEFLNADSWQGDSVLPGLFEKLGVKTLYTDQNLTITNTGNNCKKFEYDFIDCPDIAPTLAITCFGLGIEARLHGLQTLKIKESDRLSALKTELEKLGAKTDILDYTFVIRETANQHLETKNLELETFNDHRIAMSFAPLALVCKSISIKDCDVVSKSYPNFWHDLKNAGFNVNLQP